MKQKPIIWMYVGMIAIGICGLLRGQAPVQPTSISSSVTLDTNLHIVTIQASFFASNVDTLLPAITGAVSGTNAFVQLYSLNTVSNQMAIATNSLLAQIQALQATVLTNGGTNYSAVALSTTNITSWLSVTNWGYFGSAWVTNQLNAGTVSVSLDLFARDGIATNNWRAGSLTVDHDTTMGGILTVTSNTLSAHFGGNGSSPVVVTNGGAGTSGGTATLSANASDAAGYITVAAGSSPQVSSTVCTLTFAKAYATVPTIIIEPVNANARVLGGQSGVWADQPTASVNGFSLKIGSTAITNSTTYIWAYHVVQ